MQVAHALLIDGPMASPARHFCIGLFDRSQPAWPSTTENREEPIQVKKEIVVLDTDPNSGKELADILTGQPFCIAQVASVCECEAIMRHHTCCALIMDLDTVVIDNRTIVSLKKKHPDVTIIAKSQRRFHPELEESMRDCIFACLTKPLDPMELQFFLRSLISSTGGP